MSATTRSTANACSVCWKTSGAPEQRQFAPRELALLRTQ
jgi:hypothetical protein